MQHWFFNPSPAKTVYRVGKNLDSFSALGVVGNCVI